VMGMIEQRLAAGQQLASSSDAVRLSYHCVRARHLVAAQLKANGDITCSSVQGGHGAVRAQPSSAAGCT
jgi:hypothetical protein